MLLGSKGDPRLEKDLNSRGPSERLDTRARARVITPNCNKVERKKEKHGRRFSPLARPRGGQKARKKGVATRRSFLLLGGVQGTEDRENERKERQERCPFSRCRVVAISRFHRRGRTRANAYARKGPYEQWNVQSIRASPPAFRASFSPPPFPRAGVAVAA